MYLILAEFGMLFSTNKVMILEVLFICNRTYRNFCLSVVKCMRMCMCVQTCVKDKGYCLAF